MKRTFTFSSAKVDYYFDSSMAGLEKITDRDNAVIITDEHVFSSHKKKFTGWRTIVIKAGEQHKTQPTVDGIIAELISLGADRKTMLIGVGGGVVTDITGYVAGIYMRGIAFGFVPSSLLAMVDASIGGKNGIDIGMYKNMVGLIRQPKFLLFDISLLKTLPETEWQNGFAEIIKHACIRDASMFGLLQKNSLSSFRRNKLLLSDLVKRNVLIKTRVVIRDEFELSERKLLNFGHTLGHAIENMYELSHGHAISTGMAYASLLSEEWKGFAQTRELLSVLSRYGLPGLRKFDASEVFAVLRKDKKKDKEQINYILLQKIGKAVIQTLSFEALEKSLARRMNEL